MHILLGFERKAQSEPCHSRLVGLSRVVLPSQVCLGSFLKQQKWRSPEMSGEPL